MKLEKARKNIRNHGGLSDDQLRSLLNQLEIFAEILIDAAEQSSKKQLGVIDVKKVKEHNGK